MRNIKILVVVFLYLGAILTSFIHSSPVFKNKPKPIHVFFEVLATQPALLGMVEMVKLPKDETKIFLWHRFPERSKLFDLNKINAIEVSAPRVEGNVYERSNLIKKIKEVLKEQPNAPLIIYTNMNNYNYLFDEFLRHFPKEQIEHVHLFEDGLGSLYSYLDYFNSISYTKEDVELLKKYYYEPDSKVVQPKHAKYMMHTFLPVTYHFFGYEKAKETLLSKSFFNAMAGATLKDIDYKNIAKELSSKQKQMLFKLIDFNYERYKKITEKTKLFLYVGGFYFRNVEIYRQAEAGHILELLKKYPKHHFLIKPHPSYSSHDKKQIMQKFFSNKIEFLNPQLPYEIFIIAGLEPDKIAGRGSSLFYTLTNDMLDSYVPHGGYISGFRIAKNIDESKSIEIMDYLPEKPLYFDEIIVKDGKKGYVINSGQNSMFLYDEKRTYFKKENAIDNLMCNGDNCFLIEEKQGIKHFISYKAMQIIHPAWRDKLFQRTDGKFCRFFKNDCGRVEFLGDRIKIFWDSYPCEEFKKSSQGLYYYIGKQNRRTMPLNFEFVEEFFLHSAMHLIHL